LNEKQAPGWVRKRFKGNKIWMETDDQGHPLVRNEKVRIKYQLDQPHEYWVNLRDLHALDSPPPETVEHRSVKTVQRQNPDGEIPPDSIIIYTDGASSGNPGPSGIGVVMRYGEHTREVSRYIGIATNNIAELEAVRTALVELKRTDRPVRIHTDSGYVYGLLVNAWKAKKNPELVESIRKLLLQFKDVQFVKVRGHQGVPDNERADRLATDAIKHRSSGAAVSG